MSDTEFLASLGKKLGLSDEQVKELGSLDEQDEEGAKRGATILLVGIFKRFLKFLDDGDTPVTMDETPFLGRVRAKELEVFGKQTTPCPFVIYQSGNKMLYDALSGNIEEIMPALMDSYDKLKARRKPKKRMFSTAFKMAKAFPGLVRTRLLFAELGQRVMGQFDIREVTRVSGGELRMAFGNIRRISVENGIDFHTLADYVAMHEELHSLAAQHLGLRKCQKNRIDGILANLAKDEPKLTEKDKDEARAFGAAIEGHAEFFTQLFAKDLMPEFVLVRKKPSLAKKIKWRIIGLDKILANYILGPVFIEYLHRKGGVELANAVFLKPPLSMAEVTDPEKYLKRIGYG